MIDAAVTFGRLKIVSKNFVVVERDKKKHPHKRQMAHLPRLEKITLTMFKLPACTDKLSIL